MEYSEIRGIRTPATLALLNKDEDGLDRTLIQPLLQGWPREDGTIISIPDTDKPIAKATLIHMWMMAKQSWEQAQVAAQPRPPSPPATAPGTTTAAAEDKIAKTLAPGRWPWFKITNLNRLVEKTGYFPSKNSWAQRTSSPGYYMNMRSARPTHRSSWVKLSPPGTFQANGEPNPLAKRDRSVTKLTLTGEQLVAAPEEPWQPRSVLAIIDGLSSIRWCFVLCKPGSEQAVHTFFDWLVRLVRSRPGKTDHRCHECWH